MKKHRLIFLPALCLLASIEGRAAVVELDLEKLTLRSSHIFCGEVIATESEWGDFLGLGRAMITKVRIKVSEVWKDSEENQGADRTMSGTGPAPSALLHFRSPHRERRPLGGSHRRLSR